MFFVYSYIFMLGAIAGSFITAWVWRIRENRSMMARHSMCPHCHHNLGPQDLVPLLSWLWQRGRCRYCQAKISIQYPLIELSTALLFVAISYRFISPFPTPYPLIQPWPLICLLASWTITIFLIASFVYDLHWYELPDIWTLGGAGLTLIILVLAFVFRQPVYWQATSIPAHPPTLTSLLSTILSAVVAAGFFWLIIWGSEKLLHKQGMGEGDVKLAALMGLFLGFPAIIVAVYLAFILGAVLSLFLIAGKRKRLGQQIPFGPFLIVGTLVALFASPQIVSWYLQLLL